jgi:hypothetical protein
LLVLLPVLVVGEAAPIPYVGEEAVFGAAEGMFGMLVLFVAVPLVRAKVVGIKVKLARNEKTRVLYFIAVVLLRFCAVSL